MYELNLNTNIEKRIQNWILRQALHSSGSGGQAQGRPQECASSPDCGWGCDQGFVPKENTLMLFKTPHKHNPEQPEIVQYNCERILMRNVLGHKGFDLHTEDVSKNTDECEN